MNFKPLLHSCVIEGDIRQLDAALKAKDSDLNGRCDEGLTALDWAVLRKDVGAARLLLMSGADPTLEPKPSDGERPLIAAILEDDIAMVELLLEHGANINQADHNDYRPIERAAYSQNESIVEALIGRGVELQFQTGNRDELLDGAFIYGTEATAMALLKGGALHDPTASRLSHFLLRAIEKNATQCVGELIKMGADIHVLPAHTQTPLMAGNRCGHLAVCLLLVKEGADPHFVPQALTSYDWIVQSGSDETRQWRESLQAHIDLSAKALGPTPGRNPRARL